MIHYEKRVKTIQKADLNRICELSRVSANWCVDKLNYKLSIKKLKSNQKKLRINVV